MVVHVLWILTEEVYWTQGWNGVRITFGFLACPLCKRQMKHPALADVLAPKLALQQEVRNKAAVRLRYEVSTAASLICSHFRSVG